MTRWLKVTFRGRLREGQTIADLDTDEAQTVLSEIFGFTEITELGVVEADIPDTPPTPGDTEWCSQHKDAGTCRRAHGSIPILAVQLDVVLNGWHYEIPATENSTLDQVVADALAIGNHTGRPAEDWEVRDAAGVLLDPYRSKSLEELNLHRGGPDTRLYVNLRPGVAG